MADSSEKKSEKKSREAPEVQEKEKAPARRILPPPEEKMKRGRGLIVLLFIVSVLASYIFSLMKSSR